jgi:hypothetical protein
MTKNVLSCKILHIFSETRSFRYFAVTWYNFLSGYSFQKALAKTFQHQLVSYFHLTFWEEFYCRTFTFQKLHFITIVISFIFVDKWIVRYSLTFEFIVVIPMVRSHVMINCREVCSKGAVTWYNFLSGSFQKALAKTFQHQLVSYFHLTFWEEFYCENSEKK